MTLKPDYQRGSKFPRQKTMVLDVIPTGQERSLKIHKFDPSEIRSRSQMDIGHEQRLEIVGPSRQQTNFLHFGFQSVEIEGEKEEKRVPLLGLTRQQTEMYLFKMAQQKLEKLEQLRQAVIPLDGPAKHLTVGGRIISGDIAVFEDKAANAVLLEAENQLKSGYPTIATSTMVARRNKVTVPEDIDSTTDVRFFSELVKPMQYRWKFQKDKLKTITPSKRGFHQRSQSPTYQRLVEAHDKLQSLAESESSEEAGKIDKGMTDFFETQSDLIPPLYVKPSEIFRYTRSDPVSNRTSFANSIPATDVSPVQKPNEIKPEIRTIEPTKKEKDNSKLLQETTAEEVAPRKSPVPKEITSTQEPPKPIQKHHKDFKVDFKKHDSHSELHLFLPHIHDTNTSRGATPEEKQRKHKTQFTLPAIEDLEIKPPEEDKSRLKKKQKPENKKKKKYLNRIKSGKDDKQITDRLNDIPTWISLETNKDYHPESMCVFENCTLHKHKKSTKIRQP